MEKETHLTFPVVEEALHSKFMLNPLTDKQISLSSKYDEMLRIDLNAHKQVAGLGISKVTKRFSSTEICCLTVFSA